MPLLSLLIWLPIVGGALVLLAGDENPRISRMLSFAFIAFSLLLCVPLYLNFDVNNVGMQFIEYRAWLPLFNINYNLGVDGISLALIILTTFSTLITLIATAYTIKRQNSQYLAAFLILQGLLVGVFASLDAILFYIFWEASLIPMYLIIGIWGSDNRVYAAIKFFLYTFLGSVLMLVALLYLGFKANSFSILDFYPLTLTAGAQIFIFIAFLLAFAIKVPMWPVHTWLPDAHTEAPAGGSIMLAAILLKLGAYGFLRFSLPIVPDACRELANWMIALSLIAVIYIGFVAIVQRDMKKLIAYSSISHMGFVTLGFFVIYKIVANGSPTADAGLVFEGALFILFSHAFVSGALFAGVGYLYERLHTRQIGDLGGVVNTMPIFAAFLMLFAMANVGLPGTSGFVGEFMVIVGTMAANFWLSFFAAMTLILGAAYTLWMYKRAIFGEITNPPVAEIKDIRGYELWAFILLAVAVLWFGVYPNSLLHLLHGSVNHLLTLSQISKIAVTGV